MFGNVNKRLKFLKEWLHQLEVQNRLHETALEIYEVRKELNEMLTREEVMWKQRSRALWIKSGDRNTKFFHAIASQRRRTNKIEGIEDEGAWVDSQEDIERVILNYFTNIYSSNHPTSFEASLGAVRQRVTPEMNEALLGVFRAEEVKISLNQMHPTKAPGSDGMSPIFFQKYWDVVGPSVVNETFICLIPKVNCPQKISEFRPISLCNVVYKLVSKVLANRLKKILPMVISESQSAFVPDRQITDNVLVAFETMHSIDQRRKGKNELMTIKLNISKAYDRVEWAFLEVMMRKLGFGERWIGLMLMCVKTVSYLVLINGEPKGKITPTRGLRQGDPLSPYLFLLCVEGLTAMLKREESEGLISGVSVCRGAPRISHLLFADDCIIFGKASVDEGYRVLKVLADYEEELGQKLNKEKASLFFSRNTSREIQEEIKEIFRAQIIHKHERYLGLPTLVGKGKIKAFSCIKDQVGRKIAGWKGKLLSNASHEILIKAVAQATTTYTMSCFMLLNALCHDLNSMVSQFWWGRKIKSEKWHGLCGTICVDLKRRGEWGSRT